MSRPRKWPQVSSSLVLLFACGIAVRLVVAHLSGYGEDVPLYAEWGQRLVDRGPWGFYPGEGERFLVDYPPGFLYVLWALASGVRAVGAELTPFLLKLPAIAGDVALGVVVVALADRVPGGRRHRSVAAAFVLLNPVFVFVSAVWGRPDALAVAFAGVAIILLTTGRASFVRVAFAIALCGVAVLTRQQTIFIMPFTALVFLRRYVMAEETGRIRRFFESAAAGTVFGFVMILPFAMSPFDAYPFFRETRDTFPVRRVFDLNLWGLFGLGRPETGSGAIDVVGIPAVVIGTVAFVLAIVYVRVVLWRTFDDAAAQTQNVLLAAAATLCVGFALLTGFHARNLVPAIALLVPLVAGTRARWSVVLLSGVALVIVIYAHTYRTDDGGASTLLGGGTLYGTPVVSWPVRAVCAAATLSALAVGAGAVLRLRRSRVDPATQPPDTPSGDALPVASHGP